MILDTVCLIHNPGIRAEISLLNVCSLQLFMVIWDVIFQQNSSASKSTSLPPAHHHHHSPPLVFLLCRDLVRHPVSRWFWTKQFGCRLGVECGNQPSHLPPFILSTGQFHTVTVFHPLSLVCVNTTTVWLSPIWPSSSVFVFCVCLNACVCVCEEEGGGGGVCVFQQGFLQCKWT